MNGIRTEDYGKCEHAIRIPGNDAAYEIGVVNNPEGEGFTLVYDFYGQQTLVDMVGGTDCRKLVDRYAAEVAIAEMQREGWSATESWNEKTEEIVLEFTKF